MSTAYAQDTTETPERPAFSAPASLPPLDPRPSWMRRMDRADRLYRTGRTMGLVGGGTTLGGVALLLVAINMRSPGVATVGAFVTLGGALSLSYGGPVMLVAAGQATGAVEEALHRPLPRGNIVGGWVSFALLGGLPTYLFASAQWGVALQALDVHGLLAKHQVRVRPTPKGLSLSMRF